MAGKPGAARAVGNIMRTCADVSVPCHRVIGAGGALGGYGRDLNLKRGLLAAEGLIVSRGIVRKFPDVRWKRSTRRP
jgi:O6-methylguanine-DNA--protein-cysteine methyltransferase